MRLNYIVYRILSLTSHVMREFAYSQLETKTPNFLQIIAKFILIIIVHRLLTSNTHDLNIWYPSYISKLSSRLSCTTYTTFTTSAPQSTSSTNCDLLFVHRHLQKLHTCYTFDSTNKQTFPDTRIYFCTLCFAHYKNGIVGHT